MLNNVKNWWYFVIKWQLNWSFKTDNEILSFRYERYEVGRKLFIDFHIDHFHIVPFKIFIHITA